MLNFGKSFLLVLFCLTAACNQISSNRNPTVPTNAQLNASIGRLFLAKNKTNPGIQTMASGLQFHIIRNGMGKKPTDSDWVTLFYQGRYIDGTVFDNRHTQENPVTLQVSTMIPGWREAIKMMSPGAIWLIYLPNNLAFGDKGIPNLVGPNQTVVYNIHFLSIKPH
jgi:FKBP-type peptidyl-prolyl cis-trans isomerase FklB